MRIKHPVVDPALMQGFGLDVAAIDRHDRDLRRWW
jgi:hypothetical protein